MVHGMDFSKEKLRPSNHLMGYAILGVVVIASSRWTWMALVLIPFFSLYGFRGIKGFHSGFPWWRDHVKVKVMLQYWFSSSASNHTAATKNRTDSVDDNLNLWRNMRPDDCHIFSCTGESLTERDRYKKWSKIRSQCSSTVDSVMLWNSLDDIDNCIDVGSACFPQTEMMFIVEKSSSLSVAKSVSSPLRFGEKEFESPTSDQQLDCLHRSLIRLPKHEKLCPAYEFGGNECRSIEEPMQKCRGKISFSSDFLDDVECNKKCNGSLFFMNDGEGGKQLESCLSDNCVNPGLWRRLVSFEIQFGWDRLQSLRLGYGSNWKCCTGRSGLNFDQFSKYLVRDINVVKVLDSRKRNIVKLFSLQEDVVSSIDIAWNMGLSCTSTIDNTICLWDIEVGKGLNKMMVNDYAIGGSHIENSPVFLLSGVMIREEKASLFVWDPRDSLRSLDFSLGNMLTFPNVQFNENKVCVSDCFNERLFYLRMIAGSLGDCSMP